MRAGRPEEYAALGRLLGAAFQDDPVWQWIAPDPKRRSAHLGAMITAVIRSHVRDGMSWTTAELGGAAVWAPPDEWEMSPIESVRSAVPSLRTVGPASLRRGIRALTKFTKTHPREPHWYLEFLAARVDKRGQGIGSALLLPTLERCDAEGIGAYLENSKEENLGFYHRFGFEVTQEIELGAGAPPLWGMWREPR